MSKVKLDLSSFKHVKSDDKSTTLRHKDGHELTLAHTALSPQYRTQLEALSKVSKLDETPVQKQEEVQKMANGGTAFPPEYSAYASNPFATVKNGKVYINNKEMPPKSIEQQTQQIQQSQQSQADLAAQSRAAKAYETPQPMAQTPDGFTPGQGLAITHGMTTTGGMAEGGKVAKYCAYCGGMAHGGECYAEGGKIEEKEPKYLSQIKSESSAEGLKEAKQRKQMGMNPHGAVIQVDKPRKMYADPDEEVSQTDSAPEAPTMSQSPAQAETLRWQAEKAKEDAAQAQQEQAQSDTEKMDRSAYEQRLSEFNKGLSSPAQVSPQEQAIRDQYNQLVNGNKPMSAGMVNAPEGFFDPKTGMPPKNFNPNIWEQAKTLVDKNSSNIQADKLQRAADFQQGEAARAEAGLAPRIPDQDIKDIFNGSAQAPVPDANAKKPVSGLPAEMPSTNPENLAQAGFESGFRGIEAQQQAQSQLGQAQAKDYADQVQARQMMAAQYQTELQSLNQERQNHIHDIQNGYIDPDKYWDKHSKIAAGLGMILAGFNPTSRPNAAVDFLKNQMEMNLESQKANLGAKENLLGFNLRQFQNLRDAQDMTRIMQADILQNKLGMEAAKATTPMAKAAALQAKSQLEQTYAPIFQQFAIRRAITNLSSGMNNMDPNVMAHTLSYIEQVNPEQGKMLRERFVPGIGLAQRPISNDVMSQFNAHKNLDTALQDLRSWSSQHSGSLSPSQINIGMAKAMNVQNLYRDAINGGVFKKGEQEFIDQIIDSKPTKFFNSIRVLPKLNEAVDANQRGLNTLKQSYGLPVQQQGQSQEPVVGRDGRKYVPQIINGKSYMVPIQGK